MEINPTGDYSLNLKKGVAMHLLPDVLEVKFSTILYPLPFWLGLMQFRATSFREHALSFSAPGNSEDFHS